jgi:hypothetical protein
MNSDLFLKIGHNNTFYIQSHVLICLCDRSLYLRQVDQDNVVGIATGWTVRGSNPGEGEIFRTGSDRPWGPPTFLCNGYWVFPGGQATGAWGWPPTPSSADVKERVELYITHLWALVACSRVNFTFSCTNVLYKVRAEMEEIFYDLNVILMHFRLTFPRFQYLDVYEISIIVYRKSC